MKTLISAFLCLCVVLVGTVNGGERWDEQFNDSHVKGWIDTHENGILQGGYTLGLFGDSLSSLSLSQSSRDFNAQLRFEKELYFSEWDMESIQFLAQFDLYGPVEQGFWWIRPTVGIRGVWTDGAFEEVTTTRTETDREVRIKKYTIHPWWHPWCKHGHHQPHQHDKYCKPLIITKKYVKETTTTTVETRITETDGDFIGFPWIALQGGIGRTLGSLGHGAFWVEGGYFFRSKNWFFSMNWLFAPRDWLEFDMRHEWNWFTEKAFQDIFIAEFGATATGQLTKNVAVFGRAAVWLSDQNTDGVEFRGGLQIHFQ